MKKSVIKISLAFVVIAAILLILLGVRSIDGTVPSYRFLGGRSPIECKKANRRSEDSRGLLDRRYIYSFEADYNDLCSKAHAELTPDGFAVRTDVQILSGKELRQRFYYLKEKFPRGSVYIYIYDNRQYIKFPNSEHSAYCEKDGWVMIEIIYYRGWRWPF